MRWKEISMIAILGTLLQCLPEHYFKKLSMQVAYGFQSIPRVG